jgi:hypothetical protein
MEQWLISVGSQIPIPVLTVLMIYFGKLITQSQYQFAVRQMEYWRQIALTNEKTMGTQAETIRTFTVAKEMIEALQRSAEKNSQRGSHDSLAQEKE